MTGNSVRSLPAVAQYRGLFGQLDWVLRRLGGLGVLLFLILHILDTSTAAFAPSAYEFFLNIYKNPFFGLAEVALGGAVIYHAMSGLAIIILDFWPSLWKHRPLIGKLVWAAFAVLFIPVAGIMLVRIYEHIVIR